MFNTCCCFVRFMQRNVPVSYTHLLPVHCHHSIQCINVTWQLEHTADDNASGVAGLLELARLLQQQAPKTGVQLVAYA